MIARINVCKIYSARPNWLPPIEKRGNSILEQSISNGEYTDWIIQSMN